MVGSIECCRIICGIRKFCLDSFDYLFPFGLGSAFSQLFQLREPEVINIQILGLDYIIVLGNNISQNIFEIILNIYAAFK